MQRGFQTYRQINTMGMTQLDLILTVYRGTIGYLDQAKEDFATGKLTSGRTACDMARKCIVHLYTTLDMEKGENIAAQLGQLYAFMIEQIDLAVANKSCKLLGDVKSILETVKGGWESLKEREAAGTWGDSRSTESAPEGKAAGTASPPSPSPTGSRLTFSA